MKKIILLLGMAFIAVLITFFALTQSLTSQTSANVATDTKKDDTIHLKFAHHMPKNSVLDTSALEYAEEVKRKTQGKVLIDVFPNQELGNSHQMVELSRLGEIDILVTPTAKMSVAVPSMQYADLPFLFPTREDAYTLLDGEVGELLLKDLDSVDLLGVAFWEGGFKNFTANKPLLKIEDFKDLKIRVMKSRIIMEQFYALGAKPITIDFHATKQALQDGVVDAQENPLSGIVSMDFYKVQSDLTLSEHAYLAYVVSFSKKNILKLPLEIQTVLIQTAKEMAGPEREAAVKEYAGNLETLKKSGMNIHTLSLEEKARFKEATSYIMKTYEDILGAHIVSKTEEYFYKQSNKENIVAIGIDADLSMGAKGSGLAIKRGVELAVDKINKSGGLLGKQVVVVAKDHMGVSTQADENMKEFVSDKHIIALIGGKHSAIVSSYMKDIQDNKLIFFSPWAASTSIIDNGYKENYLFRVSVNDKYATKYLAQEALKKSSNPVIVVENSTWGKEALENINIYLTSKGLPKQEGIIISRGESQFEKVFNLIKDGNYDSIIMVLNSQEGQRVVTYMGQNNIKLPIISHWGIVGDKFFDANKKYLEDIDLRFIQTFSLANNNTLEAKNLIQNYKESYHKSSSEQINAITGVVQAYDAVMLLAQAIERCGSFDSDEIRRSLENTQGYNGVIKTYVKPFDQVDHDALDLEDYFMATFDKDGNITPVKE
jgi:tripartite ATP-independent transporter DctP family solute receptor